MNHLPRRAGSGRHLGRRLVWIIVAWIGLQLGWPLTGTGQEPIPESEWRRGYHGLNLLVQGMDLKIQSLAEWEQAPADQRVLIVLGSVDPLPVNLARLHRDGVSILVASDSHSDLGLTTFGIGIQPVAQSVANERDYFQFDDCPIVRNLADHPVFTGVKQLICNQPGRIFSMRSPAPRPLARLPRMNGSRTNSVVIVTLADAAPGKFLCIADSSLLTNQMLLLGDNRQFAQQAVRWLSDDLRRKSVLILADQQFQSAVDPAALLVRTPPPTRAEVIAALKNLPPDMVLEFGNAVAQVVEDDNMVNEFLNGTMDRIPPKAVNRFLILLAFGLICVFALTTYLRQKKLLRKTSSLVAAKHQRYFSRREKLQHARERQLAATVVLNSLCLDIANRRFDDWPMFPQGVELGGSSQARSMLEQMTDICQKLRQENASYWTGKRLEELASLVQAWRDTLNLDQPNHGGTTLETPSQVSSLPERPGAGVLDDLDLA